MPETLNLWEAPPLGREAARELSPRADPELRVCVGEVHLDRVDGDEQRLRDLLVREAVRGELDDALLCGRELAWRLRPAGTDPLQLGARFLGPAGGADLVEGRDGLLERAPRGAPLPQPALGAPEDQQRPGTVEPKAERSVS